MSNVRAMLRDAIDRQRHLETGRRESASDARAEARFRAVRKAAEEIRDELSHLPELKMSIAPDSVWIELYDKTLRPTVVPVVAPL